MYPHRVFLLNMNEFDIKASGWDANPMHWERSVAIVNIVLKQIVLNKSMKALEFGAGTGITGFLLKDYLKEITMMDSSPEMVRIMNEKIALTGAANLKAILFDLEKEDPDENNFDLLITQMVMHHVADINNIVGKFYRLLNPGGYLAIADLYPEDGSFHGEKFSGHKGFNPLEFSTLVRNQGFKDVSLQKCFVINKKISEFETRQFNVFLLIANKI